MRIWAVHKATFAFSAVQSSHHAHSRNVCKAGQRCTREAIPPSHRPLWHARPWRAACNCRPLPRVPRELCCWNCVHGSFSFFFHCFSLIFYCDSSSMNALGGKRKTLDVMAAVIKAATWGTKLSEPSFTPERCIKNQHQTTNFHRSLFDMPVTYFEQQ